MYELAETLSGLRSVAAIGQAALAEVGRIRGEGAAFLLIADRETRRLSTPDGVPVGPLNDIGQGDGIVGGLGSGEPTIINDVSADPRSSPAERRLGSLIVAPLRGHGVAIGAIGAATDGAARVRGRRSQGPDRDRLADRPGDRPGPLPGRRLPHLGALSPGGSPWDPHASGPSS